MNAMDTLMCLWVKLILYLRTDLKPSARFKAVWPVLKPSGRIMSGPGPFYSRQGSIKSALKPSSPVERRVVIHAARVQLGLFAPEKGSAPAIASSVPHPHAPAQRPVACPARPRACKYVRAFPPCAPLLHPVVTLPILPTFQSSKRT